MLEKVYVDRQPRVGDTVEAISNPFDCGDQKVGYLYKVKRLGNGYVVVTGDRMPVLMSEITINDNHYEIVEYRELPEPKEVHVKKYKFLGIPFGKRTTYVYKYK